MKKFSIWLATLCFAYLSLLVADAADSDIFELDTRGTDAAHSRIFTLDTREVSDAVISGVFTLDTRNPDHPVSSVFTLDTRGLDPTYPPSNITVTAESMLGVFISWKYEGNPLGFEIDRRIPLGAWIRNTVSDSTTRTWRDSTVNAGEFYEYRVAALLTNGFSDFSESMGIQLPEPPSAPRSLRSSLDSHKVVLSWLDTSRNENGFELWRKAGESGNWAMLSQLNADTTSTVDNTITTESLYTYKIRAYNGWGKSEFSKETSIAPPPSQGCGYSLTIDGKSLFFDDIASSNNIQTAPCGARMHGSIAVTLTSPSGNKHPVRVVLGFRNTRGEAQASPVELKDFYCLPGCPGTQISASIPEDFRVPNNGTNVLWMEMIMAQRDPIKAFTTERHTQEASTRKRLCTIHTQKDAWTSPTEVRLLPTSATVDNEISVPIQLSSSGGEYLVSFSIAYDEGLTFEGMETGADAPQILLQGTTVSNNSLGIGILTPLESPLGIGSKEIMKLRFAAQQPGIYAVSFQDTPTERMVAGGDTNPEQILWEDASITITNIGWEGDIAPRPLGNGQVNDSDIHLAMLFALGIIDIPDDANEFQRLDCAPLETAGNGIIDIADVIAISRYALGEIDMQPASGPTGFDSRRIAAQNQPTGYKNALIVNEIPAVKRGDNVNVPILLVSTGDIHGISYTLSFDPSVLAFQKFEVTGTATNGNFLPNQENAVSGTVSAILTMPVDEIFPAGTQTVSIVKFTALEGIGAATSVLSFTQSPTATRLADCFAKTVDAEFQSDKVTVLPNSTSSAPTPPYNFTAEAVSMHRIKLSWSLSEYATGYRLYRKQEGNAVWDILSELSCADDNYVDDGLPPDTRCSYMLTAVNPLDEESVAVITNAATWSALEDWRFTYWSDTGNTGEAKDDEDPDHDGTPNKLEFALGTDPLVSDSQLNIYRENIFAGTASIVLSYISNTNASEDVTFEILNDLDSQEPWQTHTLTPVSSSNQGYYKNTKLRLPDNIATNQMLFIRMSTR